MTNSFPVQFNISNTFYKTWFSLRKLKFELKLRNTHKKFFCWKLEIWEFNKSRGEEGLE